MKLDTCLNLEEVAKHLGVSVKTVRRRVAAGALPAYKIGVRVVVKETDLIAYISELPSV